MQQFVLKQPDDEDDLGWPELMIRTWKWRSCFHIISRYVRRMVDVVPSPFLKQDLIRYEIYRDWNGCHTSQRSCVYRYVTENRT